MTGLPDRHDKDGCGTRVRADLCRTVPGESAMPFVEHLSVRVPWHGGGWKGTVCADPAGDHACMLLDTIGKKRDDQFPYAWNLKGLEPARLALPAHSGSVGCFPRPASSCSCATLWLSRRACFGGPATVRGTRSHAMRLSRSGVSGTTVGRPLQGAR